MWDGRRREKAALRRQTRFNSNGVMGIRGAKETIYHIDKRQRYEEREREGAGCTKKTIKNLRDMELV